MSKLHENAIQVTMHPCHMKNILSHDIGLKLVSLLFCYWVSPFSSLSNIWRGKEGVKVGKTLRTFEVQVLFFRAHTFESSQQLLLSQNQCSYTKKICKKPQRLILQVELLCSCILSLNMYCPHSLSKELQNYECYMMCWWYIVTLVRKRAKEKMRRKGRSTAGSSSISN